MTKKILLLGSGELGKEFVIAAKRLGQYVIAVDSYNDAPAQQVADEREVIDMLDGAALDAVIAKHKPDLIVPEIEAIRTERFYDYERQGIQVVPSARAANFTMNRKAIRDLAAKELGLRTAKYQYATTLDQFKKAISEIGIPCVVKPLMSSSGKGQSTVKSEADIEKAWEFATTKGRGDLIEVIVEEFIKFESEITLLTVTQKNGETLFCPPIGHRQERGDYQESWQPAEINSTQLLEAEEMARQVTKALSGAGIWGVEFFLGKEEVYFSELSPRPHDTGMVTLSGSQNFSEFELHCRAVLGLPIPEITLERAAASAVILASNESSTPPNYEGLPEAMSLPKSDVKIFGKPTTRKYRRMGVALAYDVVGSSTDVLRKKAKEIADKVNVVTEKEKIMSYCKCIFLLVLPSIILLSLIQDVKSALPSKQYRKTPSDLKMQYDSLNIMTADGKRLSAWLCKPEKKRSDVIIILASGDAGNMGDNLVLAQSITESVGVNILLFDYRGFGSSDQCTIDTDLIAIPEFTTDIYSVTSFVKQYLQSDTSKIILYGRSMGASLSITTAVRYGDVGGVIAESPYVTQRELVEKINIFRKQQNSKRVAKSLDMPILEPMSVISQLRCSILLIHGQNEKFISNDQISELFNHCPSPKKTLWIASNCNHLEVVYKEKNIFISYLSSFVNSLE